MTVGRTYAVGSPTGPRVRLLRILLDGECRVQGIRKGSQWTTRINTLYEPQHPG